MSEFKEYVVAESALDDAAEPAYYVIRVDSKPSVPAGTLKGTIFARISNEEYAQNYAAFLNSASSSA